MSFQTPIVSVVIPCYNDKEYIAETLQSIRQQTFQDVEIIIVDDGSNQATKELLITLVSDKVRVITQENKGLSAARNIGFKEANGEFVLTIDSDDTVDPTFLEKALVILNKNKSIGAVSSHVSIFENDHQFIAIHTPNGGRVKDFLFDNNSVSFALIRKQAWQEIGGYDEKMRNGFEDWEFWIAITKKGWEIAMIEQLLFNYRQKPVSMSKDAKENYREANLNYIYKKHQDVYSNHFLEVVDFLTNLAQRHKKNEIKYKTGIEFKIGKLILMPFRKLNRVVKR